VGLVAASAAPILEEHTARYTTAPSQWTDSVGAPILLNQPLDGRAWSRACTQTGGRKGRKDKKNKKSRKDKMSRKTRKNRNKKNKKNSRCN
jgi:hypothetical protein